MGRKKPITYEAVTSFIVGSRLLTSHSRSEQFIHMLRCVSKNKFFIGPKQDVNGLWPAESLFHLTLTITPSFMVTSAYQR
jgi:hypothetical protein